MPVVTGLHLKAKRRNFNPQKLNSNPLLSQKPNQGGQRKKEKQKMGILTPALMTAAQKA